MHIYMHIYIYMHVCVYVCMYVCIYIYIYIFIHHDNNMCIYYTSFGHCCQGVPQTPDPNKQQQINK